MKIKIPDPIAPNTRTDHNRDGYGYPAYGEDQMDARDQQWLELVGPVVEAFELVMDRLIDKHEVDEAAVIARAALRAITEEQS